MMLSIIRLISLPLILGALLTIVQPGNILIYLRPGIKHDSQVSILY